MAGRSLRIALAIFALPLTAAVVHAGPGTEWRVTTSMSGMGMSAPARSREICATGADQNRPAPVAQSSDCTFTPLGSSGGTTRYAMRCSRANLRGTGAIHYEPGHYQGLFDVNTPHGAMTLRYEGQKLGACDGGESDSLPGSAGARERVAEQQSAVQSAMGQACVMEARSGSSPYPFLDAYGTGAVQCTDPSLKQTYCAAFQHLQPYSLQQKLQASMTQVAAGNPTSRPLTDSLKLCGLNGETVHANLCAQAQRGVGAPAGDGGEDDGSMQFLIQQCSAQAQSLAARECAGRSYTSVSDRFRNFCSSYATSGGTPSAASPATGVGHGAARPPGPPGPPKASLQSRAKKALTHLFGH